MPGSRNIRFSVLSSGPRGSSGRDEYFSAMSGRARAGVQRLGSPRRIEEYRRRCKRLVRSSAGVVIE